MKCEKDSFFTKIEKKYNWKIKGEPLRLNGGFIHRMYRLDTQQGVYAIKRLNPFVMQRETAMKNYAQAERLELLLEKQNLPILPALSFFGRKMQEIDGEYFYIFDYFEGKPLKAEEISEYHCRKIGRTLAKIHSIDKRFECKDYSEMSIDWENYIAEVEKADKRLYAILKDALPLIIDSQRRGNSARKRLPDVLSICHNDMDYKNVLWSGSEYRIIDLECLSYGNPFMELFELALCWSGYENCRLDFRLFQTFLRQYKSSGGDLPLDWEALYDCNNGRLEWLEYNIKRVLGIDCGDDERAIGIGQVEECVRHIVYYSQMKKQILKHCVI